MSFRISLTPSRRAASRFIHTVRTKLQKALIEESASSGLSQSDIARELGVHRSVINREFKGLKDMTLGRVAELAHAMGREVEISFKPVVVSPEAGAKNNASPASKVPPKKKRNRLPVAATEFSDT